MEMNINSLLINNLVLYIGLSVLSVCKDDELIVLFVFYVFCVKQVKYIEYIFYILRFFSTDTTNISSVV